MSQSLNLQLPVGHFNALLERRRHLHVVPPLAHKAGFFEKMIAKKLASAGILVNGRRSYDMQVVNSAAFKSIALEGSLGLGESYMRGEWHVARLDLCIEKIFRSDISRRRYTPMILKRVLKSFLFNLQSISRSKIVCDVHYDLDNNLYRKMLDERMTYTCGYWKDAETLGQAQINKLDLICQKLDLKPGMKVLDIGCGFGSFMKYAAQHYGVECVGYSLSKEQIAYGEKDCEGLPVKFVFQDYRKIEGKFDRIVSIGMMEAVGHKNFRTYMETIHNVLKDDGIALIHTVGHNHSTTISDPWVDRYIFPNGILPSITQMGNAIEGLFVMEDWHNFGPDYNRTLLAWNENFQNAWPSLKGQYSEIFKRMWEFYLLSFAGGFKARSWQLWQIVLTKKGRQQPDCRKV
ncbi:MAG: cyclopropane fatty acyl phospholipid synthase [Pseudobdellovibrio sp.]